MIKRFVTAFLLGLGIPCGIAWLGGYNFDGRSGNAAALAVACLSYSALAYWIFPSISDVFQRERP